MTDTIKPFHLDPATGFPRAMPDGSVINISGVEQNLFTVGGIPVLLADGTAADGGLDASLLTLQTAYNNGTDADGNSSITLSAGKDFVIYDDNNPTIFFRIDSTTGAVSISGDLIVGGQQSTVNSAITEADHYLLSPAAPGTTALEIRPDPSVVLTAPLVDIFSDNSSTTPVFTIDALGYTTLSELRVTGQLVVAGLINGVDLISLNSAVNSHLTLDTNEKHRTTEIFVTPGSLVQFGSLYPVGTQNTQEVIEALSTEVNSLRSDVTTLQNATPVNTGPYGYSHIQDVSDTLWSVQHNQLSTSFVYSLFDNNNQAILPDSVTVVDDSLVEVRFAIAITGRVNMVFYPVNDNFPPSNTGPGPGGLIA